MIFNKMTSFLLSVIVLISIIIPSAHTQSSGDIEANEWTELNRNLALSISSSDYGFNSSIMDAMIEIPRHIFLAPEYNDIAYSNLALPAYDKSLQPSPSDLIKAIVMLSPAASDTLLIAGNNAGYAAAILSKLVKKVYLIEETSASDIYGTLFETLSITNIELAETSDINSFDEIFAFDKILIHGAVSAISEKVTEKLSIQGNITFVLAETAGFQQIISIRRSLLGDNISTGGSCFFPEIKRLKISN